MDKAEKLTIAVVVLVIILVIVGFAHLPNIWKETLDGHTYVRTSRAMVHDPDCVCQNKENK